MDVTARFGELVALDDTQWDLDEVAFLIAAHAHPGLDVDAQRGRLDALAEKSGATTAPELARFLVDEGFAGNTLDYEDPRNSYLDTVLDRRLGIPITLSVLMIEIGRRLDISLRGVGMPGHFLVAGAPGEWFDPYHGAEVLGRDACAQLFATTNPGNQFRIQFLAPTRKAAIVERMLANLERVLTRRDPRGAVWVLGLHLLLPGISLSRRGELATQLGNLAQFSDAARELDVLARELPGEGGARAAAAAQELRARTN